MMIMLTHKTKYYNKIYIYLYEMYKKNYNISVEHEDGDETGRIWTEY